MLHPDTELRFVDATIGHGVFATRPIPKGTVTWVRDALDQTFSPAALARFEPDLRAQLDRYTYVDGRGDYVLCWDLARYLNHACEATCLSPGYGFEVAVRDIAADEELTDDYGTLNLDAPFRCRCGSPKCRGDIGPDDLLLYGDRWDALLASAFAELPRVAQPLWALVREKDELARLAARAAPPASCRLNHHPRPTSPRRHANHPIAR